MNKNASLSATKESPALRAPYIENDQQDHLEPTGVSSTLENDPKYVSIIDSAMDPIITVDDQETIVLFNQAAERIFRCPKSKAIGQPLNVFIPGRQHDSHRNRLENFNLSHAADKADERQQPLKAVRADGEVFPIEASISQTQVDGRKHFTAIVRDIGERVKTHQILTELEARYRAVFEHAGAGILTVDSKGRIIDANPAMEKLLQVSSSELRQKNYRDIIHPHDRHATQTDSLLKRVEHSGIVEVELQLRTGNARRVWTRTIHSAVRTPLFTCLYFVVVIEDITRKKHAERRFRRLRHKHEVTINCFQLLTDRERDVLWLMVDGDPTKIIASKLGISQKTVDVHRGRVMSKMQATSIAQLVQKVMPIRKHCHQLIAHA